MPRLSWLLVGGLVLAGTLGCGVDAGPGRELSYSEPDGSGGSASGSGGTVATGGSGDAPSGGGTIGIGGDVGLGGSAGGSEPECTPPTGPFCGDGSVNQPDETCDDGNPLPGDGCTGVCTTEPYFSCPPAGGPCSSTLRCGDGIRSPGEACDDGNTAADDGCAADCALVEPRLFLPEGGRALPALGGRVRGLEGAARRNVRRRRHDRRRRL